MESWEKLMNAPDTTVEIVGPGLVVNHAAIVILKALKDMGFQVNYKEWAGLDYWQKSGQTEESLWAFIKQKAPEMRVDVKVHPQPWGG